MKIRLILGLLVISLFLISGCNNFMTSDVCITHLQIACGLEGSGCKTQSIESQAKGFCNTFKVTDKTCSKEICFPEDCLSNPLDTGERCPHEGCRNISGKIVECTQYIPD